MVLRKLFNAFLILIVLASWENASQTAHSQTKSKPIFIDSEFNPLKALELVYGQLRNNELAIWDVHLPKNLARYFEEATTKGQAGIAFHSSYRENNIEKHIIITETTPLGESYGCHACAPLIGGIVFSKIKNRWIIESQDKYIGVIGKFGSTFLEEIKLVKIGPDRFGVMFRGDDAHQGYISNHVSLIIPYKNKLQEALVLLTEGAGGAACEDATYHQRIALEFVKGKNRDYYDIKATLQWNKGECGKITPVKETRYFTFIGGSFIEIK